MIASTALLLRNVDSKQMAGINGDSELLLIQRAIVGGDRWSGHVALPGGKAEKGETALETAKREVFEEVCVDLDEKGIWKCVGQLPTKRIILSPLNRKYMPVHAYIFVTEGSEVEVVINHEVRRFVWVKVRDLVKSPFRFDSARALFSMNYLVLQMFRFPVIDLEREMVLWGFTLRRVCLFLKMIGYPKKYREMNGMIGYWMGNRLRVMAWAGEELIRSRM